jgi:hypothetical protein
MAVDAGPGPDREAVNLAKWESDAFLLLVDASTYSETRFQLSYAIRVVTRVVPSSVIDGYQRQARKMWKPSGGSSP